MAETRPTRLTLPVDEKRDHVLGASDADFTLIEYGSYACEHCKVAHEVVANLRDRFGDRMRYVYRHLPLTDRAVATRAAEMAEYAHQTSGRFWEVHGELMRRGPWFEEQELKRIGHELGVPPIEAREEGPAKQADTHVREDALSGIRSGARFTPTFFINDRRYEGAWDESALADALLRSMGHRLHIASMNFVRWAPAGGLLLLVGTLLALLLTNSNAGPAYESLWSRQLALRLDERAFSLSLGEWVNHGLLSVFFLVVGLEIKRELLVGRLSAWRAATLPIAAAFGGMIVPAIIYLALMHGSPLAHGWGMTIATDTAFAVAIMILLGDRVPVDLRVFLTAAVIADDLVAIAVVALFYAGQISVPYLTAAIAVTGGLVAMNKGRVYRHLPYAVLGIALWFCLHEAGIHATLAGVVLAVVTPTRPPANLDALMAQAQTIIQAERALSGDAAPRRRLSEPVLRALDTIHGRIESPASKLLRKSVPWSSFFVLPIFALANAGLRWSPGLVDGHERLVLAIVGGLVVGKPLGLFVGSWLAVRTGIGAKPDTYTWRQLLGVAAFGGIGFTMSLFIAQLAFTGADFTAAKVAIFIASLMAGVIGTFILWPRVPERPET
ncbi:MAG TPA: Na+/H+ antiporter NhaA [Gemmatimonadota bacterium]|nr:Na+/H+ antiporter NhaA [Gemmatimonadota bacterium]